ncbi:MAG: helix-turn-helix domain-containing protein [Clostridia bacterium]|nr:helix-turn-helix domain-containing protein [Clostridia bacterium]
MLDFGNRLKDLRMKYGLTQEEVADKICVTKQAVSKWENGLSLPDVAALSSLAELYGTTVDYLLTGEEKVRVEKEIEIVEVEKEKIIEVEKPLSEEEKEMILYKLRDFEYRKYGTLTITIIIAFFFVIFLIVQPWGGLVFGPLLILAIVGTVYAKRRYEREKEKVRQLNIEVDEDNNVNAKNKNDQNTEPTEKQD